MSESKKKLVVLDVRTPSEYAESHVKASLNIDFLNSDFDQRVSDLDKSQIYKLYCRSGNRSGKAVERMKELGFQDLENLSTLEEAARKLKLPCEK